MQAGIGDLNQTADIANGVPTAEIILRNQGYFMFTHATSLREPGSSAIGTV